MRKLYVGTVPANSDDSLITRRIKRFTEIYEKSGIPTVEDPFCSYIEYTARFRVDKTISSTDKLRDEELRITFDTFTESLKDEILLLARAIVIERKGLTR